ncbi:perlucin-like protein [Stylophora pistillata]|uniref:perlucin-like protein n=1 Tax=Stylophora pistillata TaxID=50429 RepID=UPI000C0397B6|nr:perlucin-like protein [Stylophora pistillata]
MKWFNNVRTSYHLYGVQSYNNLDRVSKFDTAFLLLNKVCPKGWASRGKSCYLVIDIRVSKWSDARRTCQNLGGDLAVIKSADENKFIFDLVKKQKTVTTCGVWLGLNRKADNKFYWVDGTPEAGQYSAWASGEPNSVSEKCGHMYGTGSRQGKWNDLPCQISYSSHTPVVLCQKKAN